MPTAAEKTKNAKPPEGLVAFTIHLEAEVGRRVRVEKAMTGKSIRDIVTEGIEAYFREAQRHQRPGRTGR